MRQDTIKKIIFILVSISLLVLVGVWLNFRIKTLSKERTISIYTTETNRFINDKPEKAKQFFTKVFTDCEFELNIEQAAAEQKAEAVPENIVCQAALQKMKEIGFDKMKNSSAVVYMQQSGDSIFLIDAAGNYSGRVAMNDESKLDNIFSGLNKQIIMNYLQNGQEIEMWEDYISAIPDKEVVVPVEVGNGIKGYVFRGDLEN